MSRRTLYVSNLSDYTTERDLAWECGRYGPLYRCQMPAPMGRTKGYAFVEFLNERDAADAHADLVNCRIDGRYPTVQYARQGPSSSWRFVPMGGASRHSKRHRDEYQIPPSPPPPPLCLSGLSQVLHLEKTIISSTLSATPARFAHSIFRSTNFRQLSQARTLAFAFTPTSAEEAFGKPQPQPGPEPTR